LLAVTVGGNIATTLPPFTAFRGSHHRRGLLSESTISSYIAHVNMINPSFLYIN
jgi:hypothetical protein